MSARPAHVAFDGNGGAQARQAEQERLRKIKQKEQLKLVKGKSNKTARFSPRVRLLAMVATAGVFLFGVVAFHVLLSQGQFRLQKLDARASDEQAQYQKLRLQVAQLESPSLITQEAQDRLGMVPASNVIPVTPESSDMARTQIGAPSTTSGPTSQDPGAWTSIKPHLTSPSQ